MSTPPHAPRRPASAPNLSTPEIISQRIDEELRKEAALLKERKRKEVKVLLLGQAESGKSTLQKHFQLLYAQGTLDSERPSWRPAVYFNIIKAVRMILAELDFEFASRTPGNEFTTDDIVQDLSNVRTALLPLVAMEDALASEINGGVSIPGGRSGAYVRSGWQTMLDQKASLKLPETATVAAQTLSRVANEIKLLWKHPTVQHYIEERKIRVEESAEFFLDQIHRITQPDYMPTTDDILRVRLRTLGVIEHNFSVLMGGTSYNWRLFDVGGARGQRQAWVPYFDDAISIIFLAPISAFDQYLEEDTKINRIDDSLQLFTAICSNKIFEKVHLVLMLNKTDLLRQKLAADVKIKRYITSYGNRPNTYEAAASYFRQHFTHAHKKNTTESSRHLYLHFTSMLDTQTIQRIISDVGEGILQKHVSQVGLI
ncbi:guanine nucleotide binding protein, alpha subunit [Coprinopsis marcescibilis]|uniref:Guanine nucleotide binding protein, alpha subunit n=1 Tax=Coprinopsis marcescibilis TaxID=230819 RepID=A0A5C3KPX5_COPMA|nr:guanine nucleotide binding protein, alpha subunit [Coprinopsis marcescibilis]